VEKRDRKDRKNKTIETLWGWREGDEDAKNK
jgi:hypothetical protein